MKALSIPYQSIHLANTKVCVKRIDRVHPMISGNKFFKLKYNLEYAKQQGYKQIISFGGAYSNHIYALAHACDEYNFSSIGIIRGDELADKPLNHSLQTVSKLGMRLEFISRKDYREKHTDDFISKLQQQYPDAYIIPEGGSNRLAVQGCQEILSDNDRQNFDTICLAVGTGGTMAGIIEASTNHQQVIGFSALNSDYQSKQIQQWTTKHNWAIHADDKLHQFSGFGGYGRYDDELLNFITEMKQQNLPLEPIYTAKALYRLRQMLLMDKVMQKKRVLFIHTGGLHGLQRLMPS